jgi:hypothetical protein
MIDVIKGYRCELGPRFLSEEETGVFHKYLSSETLDTGIWEIYASLFKSSTKNCQPLVLRVFHDEKLYGAAIIIKCRKYGRSLFNNRLLAGMINGANIPFYLWIKFGCCMDMMSNPGFVREPEMKNKIYDVMISFLKRNCLLTVINDYDENSDLHKSASILPALPHALIDCSRMNDLSDYMSIYKNLKKKIRVFGNKGGQYIRMENHLDEEQLTSMEKCFLATAENSVFYLPYQELYLNSAINTSRVHLSNVHYFIASIDHQFIGYQAAMVSGKYLNALHGAFDRNRRTTHHAYDILFVKMVEFALKHDLKYIDFGAVINQTKQKMINTSLNMSYYVYSKSKLVQSGFNLFLKSTKIQGSEQMRFRN